jgi:hypothetical protein
MLCAEPLLLIGRCPGSCLRGQRFPAVAARQLFSLAGVYDDKGRNAFLSQQKRRPHAQSYFGWMFGSPPGLPILIHAAAPQTDMN